MIFEKKHFPLMRGLEKIFRPRDLFVPLTLFVILDILDIPDEFGGKMFSLKRVWT